MNEAFPALTAASLNEVQPGSIVKFPRSGRQLIGLATEEVSDNGSRSIVLLNARYPDRPSVIFARKWRFEPGLRFDDVCEFELGIGDENIDWSGNQRWETSGPIVSIGDQLFIRAAITEEIFGGHELVNIRTGDLYSGVLPNSLPTICSWKLHVIDKDRKRKLYLCGFEVPVKD